MSRGKRIACVLSGVSQILLLGVVCLADVGEPLRETLLLVSVYCGGFCIGCYATGGENHGC